MVAPAIVPVACPSRSGVRLEFLATTCADTAWRASWRRMMWGAHALRFMPRAGHGRRGVRGAQPRVDFREAPLSPSECRLRNPSVHHVPKREGDGAADFGSPTSRCAPTSVEDRGAMRRPRTAAKTCRWWAAPISGGAARRCGACRRRRWHIVEVPSAPSGSAGTRLWCRSEASSCTRICLFRGRGGGDPPPSSCMTLDQRHPVTEIDSGSIKLEDGSGTFVRRRFGYTCPRPWSFRRRSRRWAGPMRRPLRTCIV